MKSISLQKRAAYSIIILLGICAVTWSFKAPRQQQTKDCTVTFQLNQWVFVNSELNYAKDRALESNLTDAQKIRIDSSITQIVRAIAGQVNKQLADTTKKK